MILSLKKRDFEAVLDKMFEQFDNFDWRDKNSEAAWERLEWTKDDYDSWVAWSKKYLRRKGYRASDIPGYIGMIFFQYGPKQKKEE